MTTSRRALGAGELDHLVEHRDGHVEALDRELLLAQVGLVHEALERVDLGQAAQELALLLVGQRLAERAGLDLLAQPDALAVRGDVLDLVGDRAAVGLAQMRQRVGERRAGDADAQDLGRDLLHQLRREAERLGIERRIALGLGAERVQPRGEVAVRAVGLDQRGRGLDRLQQVLLGAGRWRRSSAGVVARRRGRGRRGGGGGRGRRQDRRPERRAEVGEDLLVEAVLALQVLLDQSAGTGRTRRPG